MDWVRGRGLALGVLQSYWESSRQYSRGWEAPDRCAQGLCGLGVKTRGAGLILHSQASSSSSHLCESNGRAFPAPGPAASPPLVIPEWQPREESDGPVASLSW